MWQREASQEGTEGFYKMSYQKGDYEPYVSWYWNEDEQRGYYIPVSPGRESYVHLAASLKELRQECEDTAIGQGLIILVQIIAKTAITVEDVFDAFRD